MISFEGETADEHNYWRGSIAQVLAGVFLKSKDRQPFCFQQVFSRKLAPYLQAELKSLVFESQEIVKRQVALANT